MSKNKLIWIFGLVLLISLPNVLGQGVFGGLSSLPIFGNYWVILFVNSLIVWFILFVLQAFIIPAKEGKEKVAIFVITLVLAIVIVVNWGGDGTGYIWNVGFLSTSLFNRYILVNTLLLGGFGWLVLGISQVKIPEGKAGQIGLAVLIIFISGLIAYKIIGNDWLWKTNFYNITYDYLLNAKTGILRPEDPGYNLFKFAGYSLMFIWFFFAFLNAEKNPKISYIISIVISAMIVHKGTSTIDSLLTVGEFFLLLIIGNQITQGKGTFGTAFGIFITFVIVETIMYQAWGKSYIVDTLTSPAIRASITKILPGWLISMWTSGVTPGTAPGTTSGSGLGILGWAIRSIVGIAAWLINKALP